MTHMLTGKKIQTNNAAGNDPFKHAMPGGPGAYAPAPTGVDVEVPDRASVEPGSPFQDALHGRSIGIKLDGKLRPNDVIEYCISEGWIKIPAKLPNGKVRKERGRRVLVKITGTVEAFWRSK